ncbi:MAG: iron-containing alcohol dehydrogenase [Desulfomonilaceae bacterium]
MICNSYNIDKTSVFLSCKKVILGKEVVSTVGSEAAKMGATKALIVTDPGVVRADLVKLVEEPLKSQGIHAEVFYKVEPEPPARMIDACAEIVRGGGFNLIIGLGGGSSLDTAKAAAILAINPGSVMDYVGVDTVPRRGLPNILIPTTAGTGSEATRVFVVTDESTNTKKVVYSDFLISDISILDPMLTLSMPPAVTADTGIDALAHAIEAYVSVNSTPFAEILALKAIELIAHNLPKAYAKGTNVTARYNMLLAANMGGSAFTSGGLGAVHGLAYILGTEYHMSHGRSNGIMLPHVMNFNKVGNLEKYARIAVAMGEQTDGLALYESADKAVGAVKKLLDAIDFPYKLSAYTIKESDLPKLVEGGMAQARLFVPNPRDLTKMDVEKIYQSAF